VRVLLLLLLLYVALQLAIPVLGLLLLLGLTELQLLQGLEEVLKLPQMVLVLVLLVREARWEWGQMKNHRSRSRSLFLDRRHCWLQSPLHLLLMNLLALSTIVQKQVQQLLQEPLLLLVQHVEPKQAASQAVLQPMLV